MEHIFSPNSGEDLHSDAHQSQIIGGDADEDHTQILGGDISPPRVSAPLFLCNLFFVQIGFGRIK